MGPGRGTHGWMLLWGLAPTCTLSLPGRHIVEVAPTYLLRRDVLLADDVKVGVQVGQQL